MKKQNLKQRLQKEAINPKPAKKKRPKFFYPCGHNPCPRCGAESCGIVIEDMYYLGCRKCGIEHDIHIPYCNEDPSYAIQTMMRTWNRSFLNSQLTHKAMSKMGIKNEDYLVIDRFDEYIYYVASSTDEVLDYLWKNEHRAPFDIYQIKDGIPTLYELNKTTKYQ